MNTVSIGGEIERILRKHWKNTVTFTDICHSGTQKHELSEGELLPGEMAAVIFNVGCYTVRSAERVYRVCEPGYSPDLELPASQEEMEPLRKNSDLYNEYKIDRNQLSGSVCIGDFVIENKLRVTHEISARHISNPNPEFTYICRAAHARNYSWCEGIGTICTAKEHDLIPDEYASLIVHKEWSGSSYSSDTWYKLEPTGKITTLRSGSYGIMSDDARFS